MRGIPVIVLPFLLLSLAARPPTARAQGPLPRFEEAPCPFKVGQGIVEGKTLRCGFLVVPEDRSKSASSSVRLAVAIFKTPSVTPAPDPVVFLQGGPGSPLLGLVGPLITAAIAPSALGRRDLILLDQRGTGYSQPSLDCPETTALKYRTLAQNLSLQETLALGSRAARQCRDRLIKEGVNLNAYTTLADAADVRDLRLVLGYKQWNLSAASYGTRLALTIMRAFPTGIRSVILDSVYPMQSNLLRVLGNPARGLDLLARRCAADAACNAAYPHLKTVFSQVVDQLNAKPVLLQGMASPRGGTYKVLATGDVLIGTLFAALYATKVIPLLPKMIFAMRHGDYTFFSRLYDMFGFEDIRLSAGLFYSVECSEDAPFITPQQIGAAARALPASLRSAFLTVSLSTLIGCDVWDVPRVTPAQKAPVRSALPTLLLTGEYDPITPPATATLAAQGLRHSFTFTFPGRGHGILYSGDACPDSIAMAFLDNPTHKPDARCIAAMARPPFVVSPSGS